MADTRTVSVRLKADVTSYSTSMKKASQDTAAFDKQQARSQARAEKWRAVGLASQVGGAALAAGLLAATKAASNQEQAVGSLTATFRVNGDQMVDNAKKATQMGLSITDYSNSAAKLGAQLGNLGVDQADLGGITDDLIRKAGDLAAKTGGTTLEAVDALGAAFRGEADPAEAYGLSLNITAVNAEMAATGADRAGAMMSLLNKQMEKSGAVGTMAREFDSAASSVNRAQSEFDNATASLGEALLPAMARAAEAASKLLGMFNDLPQPVKNATTFVVAFGAAALIAGPRIMTMVGSAAQLKTSLMLSGQSATGATTKLKGFAATAGKIGAVGTAAAIAIPLISEIFSQLSDWEYGSTSSDLNLLGQQVVAFGRDGTTAVGRFGSEIMGLGDAFAMAGSYFQQEWGPNAEQWDTTKAELGVLDQTLADMVSSGHADEAAAAVKRFQDETVAAGGSVEDVTGALPAYADATKAAGLAADNAATSSNAAAEAKENEAAALKKATEAYDAYIGAVQEALGLLSAQNNMAGQVDRLTAAVKENGTALDKRSKAGRANRDVMIGELGSIADVIDATQKNVTAKHGEAAGLKAANRVRLEELARLKDSAAALGYNKQKVNDLVRASGLAEPIKMPVSAPGLDATNKKLGELAARMGSLVGDSLNIPVTTGGRGGRHAAGGYITGPGSGTSDSIPANLSNGEYVLKASAVKRIGVGELNRMNYAAGGVVGYAKGGKAKGKGKGGGQGNGGLGNVQKWTDAVKDARDNLRDIKQEAADYAKSIADNILSGTGLFDMFSKSKAEDATKGLATAQTQLAEASRKVAEAQIAVNTAAPEDRAAAIKNLADAQRDLASAQTDQASAQAAADAAAPTPANIMGRMRARADAIEAYASKVKTLMGKGLSMGLIKELAGSDMVEAGPVLDALLSMSPEALKQLGAVDKRAKDAAASIGDAVSTGVGVPGGGAFGGKIGDAKAELTVSTDGLGKAIRLADRKYLDKQWRKTLNKAGLSAEERVQLMQSLKANDGKLTKHWRNVLAKAGLSAEERADLVTAITGADTTVGREWRDKLQETGLSAKESAEIAAVIDGAKNPSKALRRYWIDELQQTGLSAKESASLADDIASTKHPSKALYRDWLGQLQATGLTAREAADMIGNIQASNKTVNDNYTSGKDAQLGANKSGDFNNKISGANNSIQTDYQGKDAVLDNKRSDSFATTNSSSTKAIQDNYQGKDAVLDNKRSDSFGETNKNATQAIDDNFKGKTANLDAKADKTGINLAIAAGKKLITDGFAGFKVKIGADVGAGAPAPGKKKKARGGYISGPGTGTSDSILAALSNGEYVVRASSVRKYGTDMLSAINTGRYANGGPVGFRTTTSAPIGGAGGVTTTSVPVIVQLDGRTIAQSQLKLQRQSGGTFTVGG